VRRIFGATGVRVLALSRLRFGPFSVEACGEAGWYRLTEEEVAGFYAAQGLELPARVIEVEPAPLPSLPPG
jgi:16S rRNA U516 pseudouridylate synthase RsuA-like enzyme